MANKFTEWFKTGPWVLKNLVAAAALIALLLLGSNLFLTFYTRHGTRATVPDLTNMTVAEAKAEARKANLRVDVADSIYVRRMRKGLVYTQYPKPGDEVKRGRPVHLVVNSSTVKMVKMPRIEGCNYAQAKSLLQSAGLTVGRLSYNTSDQATNNVISASYRGRRMVEGSKVESGTPINLELGLDLKDNRTKVPDVTGMNFIHATESIHDGSLNIGTMVFDSDIRNYTDSLKAVVYKQEPSHLSNAQALGREVKIYLTLDATKVPEKGAVAAQKTK